MRSAKQRFNSVDIRYFEIAKCYILQAPKTLFCCHTRRGFMKIAKSLIAGGVLALAATCASASEYGCQVLLCLSNPQGPMAVQQCVPPIQKFLQGQAKKPPEPFPQCEEAQGQAGVQKGTNPYDACPDGTVALADGKKAIVGMPPARPRSNNFNDYLLESGFGNAPIALGANILIYNGIGDGSGMQSAAGKLICVGANIGPVVLEFDDGLGNENSKSYTQVEAFDRVIAMDPAKGSAQYFDVQVNGKPYRRVRF
jgi:hypothetical protein